MRWWDYVGPFATIAVSVGLSMLMAGSAAERRLDRRQARELDRGPVVNPQKAQDAWEATDG